VGISIGGEAAEVSIWDLPKLPASQRPVAVRVPVVPLLADLLLGAGRGVPAGLLRLLELPVPQHLHPHRHEKRRAALDDAPDRAEAPRSLRDCQEHE
jgi:hypothetical protein